MIEMDEMESAIARAGQAAEELQGRVASVAKKTQNIKQTAVVFLAKSRLLDEMDRMATAMKGAHIIEALMYIFSLLTTLLHLLWTRDQRQKQ
jgi:hypothetical protein